MSRRHRQREERAQRALAPFVRGAVNDSPEYLGRVRQTAIAHGGDPDQAVADFLACRLYTNGTYSVFVRDDIGRDGQTYTHLSIKRDDREVIDDFRVFQAIKNALVGPEREAVQVYPAESQLVDLANQYHLWVMPEGYVRPFGFFERLVDGEASFAGTKQRPIVGVLRGRVV